MFVFEVGAPLGVWMSFYGALGSGTGCRSLIWRPLVHVFLFVYFSI